MFCRPDKLYKVSFGAKILNYLHYIFQMVFNIISQYYKFCACLHVEYIYHIYKPVSDAEAFAKLELELNYPHWN